MLITKTSEQLENKLLNFITNSNEKSHSFVLTGEKGIGKTEVMRQTAHKLLKTEDLTTHPNILWIDAEEENISVGEIRNIGNFMYRTTYYNKLPKLIVIDCVENLNIHSLNALLKILEEPTKNTYFILISHNLGSLPDTIKSRCVIVNASPPNLTKTRKIIKQQLPELSDDQLNEYLSISHTPGAVIELANNNVLEIYKEMLEMLGANNKASNKLYIFIEKNFSKIEHLETFQILIKNFIRKAIKSELLLKFSQKRKVLDPRFREDDESGCGDDKNVFLNGEEKIIKIIAAKKSTQQLLALDQEIDYLINNSKTLGLDVRGVILIIIHKLMQ